MNRRVVKTVLKLSAEYVIITAPIFVYTAIEAVHHDEIRYVFQSPEWSIATIFLTIQAFRMYRDEIDDGRGHPLSNLLTLFLAAVTLVAGINTYIALGNPAEQSLATAVTKWGLFVVASVAFVFVAGAAVYAAEPANV